MEPAAIAGYDPQGFVDVFKEPQRALADIVDRRMLLIAAQAWMALKALRNRQIGA